MKSDKPKRACIGSYLRKFLDENKWVKWVAIDMDGQGYGYEEEPKRYGGFWNCPGKKSHVMPYRAVLNYREWLSATEVPGHKKWYKTLMPINRRENKDE